jgi:hypothetical protein
MKNSAGPKKQENRVVNYMEIEITQSLMELRPSWEAANSAAIEGLPSILWNPKGSLACSQEPSTGPYPEPDKSNPYHPILSL